MLSKVKALLGLEKTPGPEGKDHDLALATAALMVQVSLSDGHFSDDERHMLTHVMRSDFDLSGEEIEHLLADAEQQQRDATCLYRFTRVITADLDQDGRQDIVRALWHVALADGVVDNFEANVLAKVAGLLGVIPADRVRLKHEVEAAMAATGD